MSKLDTKLYSFLIFKSLHLPFEPKVASLSAVSDEMDGDRTFSILHIPCILT